MLCHLIQQIAPCLLDSYMLYFGYHSREVCLVMISVVTIPDFAMRYVSRYLGHDAIRIAILVYRVSQSLELQFVYDGSAIYI